MNNDRTLLYYAMPEKVHRHLFGSDTGVNMVFVSKSHTSLNDKRKDLNTNLRILFFYKTEYQYGLLTRVLPLVKMFFREAMLATFQPV